MGTRRISYQDLREKREAHEKKQGEIEYIRLHFGAIVDPFYFLCLFFTEQYFTLHTFNSTFYFGAYLHLHSKVLYACIQ